MQKECLSPAKSPSYSQLGAMSDSSLNSLRDQIKKVMIPMLIKIFQLKLELSQSISLPSRLQPKVKETPDAILQQLKTLDEDLKLLALWCDSARHQIAKALSVCEEERTTLPKTTTTATAPHPGIAKSFSTAFSCVTSPLLTAANSSASTPRTPHLEKPKKWWRPFSL